MRMMLTRLATKSAKKLGQPNTVKYLQPAYVKSILQLAFGLGLGSAYVRSHHGPSLASVHYMRGTAAQAAASEELGHLMDLATHTTPDDESKRQGKPGTAPQGIDELIKAIEVFVIHWHSIFTLGGEHAREVLKIRAALKSYVEDDLELTQVQIDDVFWSIFLDGRRSCQSPEEARYSNLSSLRKELENKRLVPCIGVPHTSLSPGQKRTADSLESPLLNPDDSESPPKKARQSYYGDMDHHNNRIKLKWATVCERNGNAPLLVNFLRNIDNGKGGTYTLKSFAKDVVGGKRCAVGTVTGSCTKKGCTMDHTQHTNEKVAAEVCSVLDKGLEVLAASKKEG